MNFLFLANTHTLVRLPRSFPFLAELTRTLELLSDRTETHTLWHCDKVGDGEMKRMVEKTVREMNTDRGIKSGRIKRKNERVKKKRANKILEYLSGVCI